jgi:hypothetical protein
VIDVRIRGPGTARLCYETFVNLLKHVFRSGTGSSSTRFFILSITLFQSSVPSFVIKIERHTRGERIPIGFLRNSTALTGRVRLQFWGFAITISACPSHLQIMGSLTSRRPGLTSMVQSLCPNSVGNFSHAGIVACLLAFCTVIFKNRVVFCSLKTAFLSLKLGFCEKSDLLEKNSGNRIFWRFAYFTTSPASTGLYTAVHAQTLAVGSPEARFYSVDFACGNCGRGRSADLGDNARGYE